MNETTRRGTIRATLGGLADPPGSAAAPIPGYEFEERLGAGGYGEVWRAKTPDGLMKAIKIVYGTIDEARAVAERKSLERFKEVRHPFILTLERIEITEGRLVIVTELADKSLRDHFEECGGCIPREEILRYLSDAAEALDYMFDKHSLQHLDIKPENLLLLGDHVKVADFGLAKTLDDASMSAVSGLTPHYVAPEVLEGHPSQHSDQYSLAIVYQTMLTGIPPFQGRTAAQLVSQHLHSPPDLSGAPAADQSVLARALSKNPARRFGSCSEFVSCLSTTSEQKSTPPPQAAAVNKPSYGGKPRIHVRQLDASEAVLTPLPPVSLDDVAPACRPTLVLGIGGVARRVLQSLRRRLADGLESGEDGIPAGLLYIDTDERAVSDALHGSETESLKYREVLPIPLRPAAAYRPKFKVLGEWMSRRWLFNIPRSGLTEGIRPLGRLAFVDHYRDIRRRLTDSLSELLSDESITRLQSFTSLEVDRENPRVFIVASLGGGTGSGAVLDVGYAVQSVLREMDLQGNGTYGILLQPRLEADSQSLLSAANATACLNELYHYTITENYPGNRRADIPTMGNTLPFSDAYLVPDASEPDAVAEYLYRSLAGPTATFFDFVRSEKKPNDGKSVFVRSFSVAFNDLRDAQPEFDSPSAVALPAEVQVKNGPQTPATVEDSADREPAMQLESVDALAAWQPVAPSTDSTPQTLLADSNPVALPAVSDLSASPGESPPDASLQTDSPPDSSLADSNPHVESEFQEPGAEIEAGVDNIPSIETDTEVTLAVDVQAQVEFDAELGPEHGAHAAAVGRTNPKFKVDAEETPHEAGPALKLLLESAQQSLPFTRGTSCLLISTSAGDGLDPEQMRIAESSHGEKPTVLLDGQRGEFVCFETGDTPLADFAALLKGDREHVGTIAERLHSRIDVDW